MVGGALPTRRSAPTGRRGPCRSGWPVLRGGRRDGSRPQAGPTAARGRPAGRPRPGRGATPPAVHHRGVGRSRALPDRVLRARRVGGRPDGRPAPDPGGTGTVVDRRRRGGPRGTGRRPGHVPAGHHRGGGGPRDPHRAVLGSRRHLGCRATDPRGRWSRPGGGHHHRAGPGVAGRAGRGVGKDRSVHHAGVRLPVCRPVDDQLPPAPVSLLALVQAFVGPRWRDLYAGALGRGYRFLSFGDAQLLDRTGPGGAGPAS